MTREDLVSVGVDMSDPSNISVTAEQSDALLRMSHERRDMLVSSEYPGYDLIPADGVQYAMEPKQPSVPRDNFYARSTATPSLGPVTVPQLKGEELYAFVTDEGDVSLVGKNGASVATVSFYCFCWAI